ncbi:formylmethanofuran dehydrogenase [Ideonella sp. 4Y16]|uniref:Formylmethanofuran dehydrogenase n=1 Tax=Ideonella alba TaxID=2824118 RepID=A0A941BBA8_9BURK|nr:formylmethanofuran dehydrogenase [Ideonella alba]MBQ0930675.1 formylmethanofuran dehydrogenase [Ideonella alba]MBQ0944795.1 formylmethanofuran dehydrogenase [Ideonella alba]
MPSLETAMPSAAWTCPFCPLMCEAEPGTSLACPRLDARSAALPVVTPLPDDVLDQRLVQAVAWLRASRQPVFGGLGTDVAGARALQALADPCGAVVDGGVAMAQPLRAQQDRGSFSVTLAEARERADLIVLVGSWPMQRAPRLRERLSGGPFGEPAWVALGAPQAGAVDGIERIEAPDLFRALSTLAALLDQRRLPAGVPQAWRTLATRLAAARYAVLVFEPGPLGPQAGLLIERINTLVTLLNRQGRAASLSIGAGQGLGTVQQVLAWRTGLPLQSRRGPLGREHDPLTLDGLRQVHEGSADLLLWVSAYGEAMPPSRPGLRRIVLGAADQVHLSLQPDTLFFPVGTPGLDHGGHLHRTDGVVVLPLFASRRSAAPAVATVLTALLERLMS